MQPMGRKYFKDKTGGKHHIKYFGKTLTWWEHNCTPNKKAERQLAKKNISNEIQTDKHLTKKLSRKCPHGQRTLDD